MRGKKSKDCNIPLGLAICGTKEWRELRKRWHKRLRLSPYPTCEEMAALCGCRRQAIEQRVTKALRKMRFRLCNALTETEIRETLIAMSRASHHKEYDYHLS